ncbi:serine hydrolase domain-containing protein [Christiangramia sp. OXR-203]|uniref:serine hydrolase domain-containing protein n=1 Tax=Christiangramia sp. OXR-203 TaxID=3100176 RepID=UPI002AC8B184|nr:serine hydrolase domain-containing protein [Christiangramia sp. OXR-203]WPY98350.1 serine hydrolase domain-containing protein [Christiangramia sp. OXR-203]
MTKRTRTLLIALALTSTISCNQKNTTKNKSTEEIVKYFAGQFLDDDRIHSVSIALVNNGKEDTFHFGQQNPNRNNPPTDSTLYELASVTKTFTGTLVAKAVLDGKITLDDDIRDYLPREYPNFEYEGEAVTIKDIITHTGGFPNFPPSSENKEVFWKGLHQIKIDLKPGTEFNYSNTAPEITAYILEQVYDIPYQQLVTKFILEPNGMTNTKFVLDENEKKLLIQGYNGDKKPQEHFKNNLWGGISGLHSNTTDLLKYIKYSLNDSILEVKESRKNFFSTQYDFDIGYHWNIVEIEDEICYRHHGGIWGMQNWLMIFPESNFGIAVLSNASFEGGLFSEGIDDKLENLALKIKSEMTSSLEK